MPTNTPDSSRSIDMGHAASTGSAGEVFIAALRLGVTSFGGPIAHLGYFRHEYVVRRRWLDDHAFTEIVGLCQFLPGPASSQVGFAIGWLRAGPRGALAAWTAFTFPSVLLMLALAWASGSFHGPLADAVVHGLKIAAVAVVAQAVIGMARTMTPDLRRMAIAVLAASAMLLAAGPSLQVLVIAAGALAGIAICKPDQVMPHREIGRVPTRRLGLVAFALFALLLLALPMVAQHGRWLGLVDIFYRSGALVFGGGHVVLPLLRDGLVPQWLDPSRFLAGYGAAQALPGPLFSIAGYLGAVASPGSMAFGALAATAAIFLPGLLLVTGALAFRGPIMGNRRARRAIAGVNAAVVGMLAAALYDPLWTSAIASIGDFLVAALGLLLLVRWRTPPILMVGLCVIVSAARVI